MRLHRAFVLFLGLVWSCCCSAAADDTGRRPDTTKPWTRWWWPGSAVDEARPARQPDQFAAPGPRGVGLTPIFGVRGYEERTVAFLSPRWMELLAHPGRGAPRLGLGVDMATGTGWPFGGPWVPPEDG